MSFRRVTATLYLSTDGTRRLVPVVTFNDRPAPGTHWRLERKTGLDSWETVSTAPIAGELRGERRGETSRSARAESRRWFGPLNNQRGGTKT